MKFSQRFWRGLVFLFLITALCGSFAVPVASTVVHAAPQLQTATNVVISEFRTRGPSGGNDEFIELYNPTPSPIDISGWLIRTSNAMGGINTRFTVPTGTLLQSGQHYLIVGTAFSGSVAGEVGAVLSAGIPDNGGIAITLANTTTIIDQVGMDAGSTYQEGTVLAPLSGNTDQSYERRLGGASDSCQETNNNSTDFQLVTPSLPQNTSSPLSLCGVILPTLTSTSTPSNTPTNTATPTPTNTASPTNTGPATNTSPPGATGIVISEFRAIGATGGNDEFIELYNPTSSPISIGNWMIKKSAGCGSAGVTPIATIPSTVTLAAGQHYLIGGSTYSGTVAPDLPGQLLSIANDGGIALLQSDGVTIVDQVGLCNTTQYREGTALAPITVNGNRSYDRKSATSPSRICIDSNNNAADFISRSPSDPQNFASLLTACGNPTPTPTVTPLRTATARPSPTRTLSPPPPPPLVAINEFVPRPGHDWNNDGIVNVEDEYVEILNHGTIDVNLSGYSLDDEVNIGSSPYSLPAITISPGERIVFYGSETGLLLSDGGDGVRLLSPNGQLTDAYNYRVVRFPDQSFCRLPDNGGLDDWNTNCFPTPGLQNALSGSFVGPPNVPDAESQCPIADTLPVDFILAECPPFGNNIWRASYWDEPGWYGEKYLPENPGKWQVFVD